RSRCAAADAHKVRGSAPFPDCGPKYAGWFHPLKNICLPTICEPPIMDSDPGEIWQRTEPDYPLTLLVTAFPIFSKSVIHKRAGMKYAHSRGENHPVRNGIRIADLEHQLQLARDVRPMNCRIAVVNRMVSLIVDEQTHEIIYCIDRAVE